MATSCIQVIPNVLCAWFDQLCYSYHQVITGTGWYWCYSGFAMTLCSYSVAVESVLTDAMITEEATLHKEAVANEAKARSLVMMCFLSVVYYFIKADTDAH